MKQSRLCKLRRKFKDKFNLWFTAGLSPRHLAKTMAIALMISIFPIYGVTTIILVLISLRFKMNLAILISTSYLFTPVQLLLIPVFFKSGYLIFEPTKLSLINWELLTTDGILTLLETLSWGLVYGVLIWAIVGPFLGLGIYLSLKWLFCQTSLQTKFKSNIEESQSFPQTLKC